MMYSLNMKVEENTIHIIDTDNLDDVRNLAYWFCYNAHRANPDITRTAEVTDEHGVVLYTYTL